MSEPQTPNERSTIMSEQNTLPVSTCIHCRPGRLCEYHKPSNNPEVSSSDLSSRASGMIPLTEQLQQWSGTACATYEAWTVPPRSDVAPSDCRHCGCAYSKHVNRQAADALRSAKDQIRQLQKKVEAFERAPSDEYMTACLLAERTELQAQVRQLTQERDGANANCAALVKAEAAYRESEYYMLRQLSDALTGGNASDWGAIVHAAEAAEARADAATRTRERLVEMAEDWKRAAEDARIGRGQRTRPKAAWEVLDACSFAVRAALTDLPDARQEQKDR